MWAEPAHFYVFLFLNYVFFHYWILLLYSTWREATSSTATVTATATGNKHALIVGISDYFEAGLKLNYADNDAALFKNYLSLTLREVAKLKATFEMKLSVNFKVIIQSKKPELVFTFWRMEHYSVENFWHIYYDFRC